MHHIQQLKSECVASYLLGKWHHTRSLRHPVQARAAHIFAHNCWCAALLLCTLAVPKDPHIGTATAGPGGRSRRRQGPPATAQRARTNTPDLRQKNWEPPIQPAPKCPCHGGNFKGATGAVGRLTRTAPRVNARPNRARRDNQLRSSTGNMATGMANLRDDEPNNPHRNPPANA